MAGQDLIERDNDTVPVKKTQKPGRWQVVLHYGSPHHLPCCTCLLTTVFNKSGFAAAVIMKEAEQKGKVSVMTGWHDIVETKTAEAEAERQGRISFCSPQMARVKFTAEPL